MKNSMTVFIFIP